MSIKETAKYRILANTIQKGFGNSSLVKYPTHFIKANILTDNRMQFICQTTVNFGHQNVFIEMRKKYISECISLVQQTMQIIEEDYRKCIQDKTKLLEPKIEPYEKPAPKSIKLKIIDETIQDDIEYVSYSLYDPKKTAYFRLSVVVEII
jgi:hypothetical protein